ncbi:unnamed protein product, partial [Aureobasidium vineae]
MQLTSATLLVAGLAAQQASAHFSWALDAGKFSTCSNADTQCSTEQHKGYDWTGLTIGHPVTSYGANTFSGGWTCNSIKSKRDELTKRTFNNKCVSGKLPSWGSSGSSNYGAGSLSIGCSGEKNKFSISEMHISSTYDTHVDCHYNMPDGSTCKQNVPCQAGGSIIKNTQCGGAISVSFSQGKPSSGSTSSNKGDCNLNIHSVGFACGSGSSSTSVSLPSSVLIPSSSAVYSSSEFVSFSTASPETTSSETTSAELPSTTPSSVEIVSSTVVISSGSVVVPGTSVPFPTGYQNQTTTQPTIGSSSEASPAESTSSSVVVPIGTGYYLSAASSVVVPRRHPRRHWIFPSSSTGVYANSTVVSSALTSSAASPAPSADCPGVVPSCLNTYLHNTKCANNADADCYCKDEDFINSVYQCIDAYGGSDENVSQAMSYMVGICAKAIPSNPAIITAVPSSIDIQPSSSTVNAATGSLSSTVPVGSLTSDVPAGSLTSEAPTSSATDSIVYVTDVVKSTLTTCPVGETSVLSVFMILMYPLTCSSITASGSTTVLTAPSVIPTVYTTKSTITASIISSVTGALPSGESPYETSPVQTSPAEASPSEASPAETTSSASVHVQVPHTVTLFSTQIATITSCAPEVTNCPATLSTSLIPTGSTTSNIWIPVTSAQETSPAETMPAASSGVYSGVVSSAVEIPATSAQETSPAQTTSAGVSSGISSGISSGVIASEVPSASSPASSGAYETSPAETTPAVSSAPLVPKTVTLFSTKIDTITSCAADITNCPARVSTSLIATGVTTAPAAYETGAVPAVPEVQSTVIVTDVVKTTVTTCPIGETITASGKTTVLTTPSVITSQITIKSTISTTVPAQTQTVVSPEFSSADAVMPSSAAVTSAPQAPKTLTIYSSVVVTITSCAPDVTNCPASSTIKSTSFYAVGTTVSEAPIVPGPSEVAPATTAPAVVSSSSTQPKTTITYSSELVVPCTYTAGESQGATIPNSMTTSTIHRTLTVPQVQFITSTVGGKPTVGLTYPSAVPATTTPEAMPTSSAADAATPAVSAASSGFAPKSSTLASTYNTPALPTGSPISYTGAGAKVGGSLAGLALAAVAAIFVL